MTGSSILSARNFRFHLLLMVGLAPSKLECHAARVRVGFRVRVRVRVRVSVRVRVRRSLRV